MKGPGKQFIKRDKMSKKIKKKSVEDQAEEIAARHAQEVILDRILNEGIIKNAEAIASIVSDGGIACVVYELREDVVDGARDLGWDGETPAFEMNEEKRKLMAFKCGQMGDVVTKKWLESERQGKIFVMAHAGTLLVNFDPEDGYSLEPGSTDMSWAS